MLFTCLSCVPTSLLPHHGVKCSPKWAHTGIFLKTHTQFLLSGYCEEEDVEGGSRLSFNAARVNSVYTNRGDCFGGL